MTSKYTPAVNFEDLPARLPHAQLPIDADHGAVAVTTVNWLNDLHQEHLASNVVWRDFLSLTDTYRTLHSPAIVHNALKERRQAKLCSDCRLSSQSPRVTRAGDVSWLDIDFDFTVNDGPLLGKCSGTISVIYDAEDQWKIWLIRTWLENYDGYGHPERSKADGAQATGESRPEDRAGHIYDVIVVGGGQSGLGVAGRCHALGLDSLLLDDRPQIGDSWGQRYKSLKWHTIKEHGSLPFGPTFPAEYPTLLSVEQIAAGYRAWAEKHGLNTRSGTKVDHADWDEASQLWTVYAEDRKWQSKNLVLSIGPFATKPVSPAWASPEKVRSSGFRGTLLHSVDYTSASGWAGRRGVVVGTANSGHDVAGDMFDAGMKVTMLQRNPTFVFPVEWLIQVQSHIYDGKSADEADMQNITRPIKLARDIACQVLWAMMDMHPERFDALEEAGFKVDRHADLYDHLFFRYGGHYVDIGNGARIIDGKVHVKGEPVQCLTERGLRFEDGSELEADVIVLCTGYNHDFRKDTTKLLGPEIADQMDVFGGTDREGELRGYSKLAGHPHLIYHGSETALARFYSKFVALQLQRLTLGVPLVPYRGYK